MAGVESEVFIDPGLYQRLREAVVEGDEDKVRGLLQKFSRDEARNILQHCCSSSENEVPLLIVAIRHRHVHLVQLFVDHYHVTVDRTGTFEPPEDSEIATKPECSPLLESMLVSCPKILDIISKKVQDINSKYPVHLACQTQTPEARKMLVTLLRNGADVNLRDNRGLTPLITACQYGNTGMAHKLLRYGASVNLCSTDGNTALHCLIERFDDVTKSKQKRFRGLSKVLVQHGTEHRPNAQGLTQVRLACLKGNTYMVEILLDNSSVNDREKANCFELLASSVYHIRFLRQAMELRHSHDPPLWKCRKPGGLETILSCVEAQTSDELLAAIAKNYNGLSYELLLTRQRIIGEALYNDYLLPYIGQYIHYKMKTRYNKRSNIECLSEQLALLLYSFKMQQKSRVPPSSDILKDRMGWIFNVCLQLVTVGTDMSVFGKILDAIDEFYRCRNAENVWLTTYICIHLLVYLRRMNMNPCIMNDECIDSQAMVKRYLRLTKRSLESNLNPSTSESNTITFRKSIGSRNSFLKLVTGNNMLHIACWVQHPRSGNATLDVSYKSRDGLVELLKLLHACGEDVNAQNSDGETPLHVFLYESFSPEESSRVLNHRWRPNTTPIDFTPTLHSLLLEGANPNLRDNLKATSLHAAMIGYARYFASFCPLDLELTGWTSIVELLMKSGANPNAIDLQGFTPLHVFMDKVFREYKVMSYDDEEIFGFDGLLYHPQLMHDIVLTVVRYGGCANAVTNDGRTVFDMCKDEDLNEEMARNIRVTCVYLTLSHLAAAAIRRHQVQYHDKLPTRLIKMIELRDWPIFEELTPSAMMMISCASRQNNCVKRYSWVEQPSRMSLFCINVWFAYISFFCFYTENK